MSNEKEMNQVCAKLKQMLEDLQFGSITLVVQDGEIIQMEKNEKVRLK